MRLLGVENELSLFMFVTVFLLADRAEATEGGDNDDDDLANLETRI